MLMFKKKKYQKLATAIAMGFMVSNISIPYTMAADPSTGSSSDSTSNSTDANDSSSKKNKTAEVMGALGAIAIPGSNAKATVNIISGGDNGAKIIPQCRGTKAPTQNEAASYTCALVGRNKYGVIYGAALPIRGDVAGGKQDFGSVAAFRYIESVDPKTKRPIWRIGYAQITVGVNGYQGETSISGGSPFGDFGTGDGSGDPFSGGGVEGPDPTPGITTEPDPGDEGAKGSSKCFDGTYFCSDPTDSTTLFGPTDTTGVQKGSGYYDSNGNWHEGENPYPNGYYDNNGQWHTDTTDSGNKGDGSSTGYYDKDGQWHQGESPYTDGYYDKDGQWHQGSTSGTNSYDKDSDSNYGDALNNLLNDSNGYNSGDFDWGSSKGGSDGSDNLDSYLNGVTDSNGTPDGLTDDVLGVDEGLFDNAANTTDGNTENNADGSNGLESAGRDSSDGSDELADNADTWDGSEGSLQELLNSMDGVSGNDDGSGNEQENEESGSLADKIQKFLHSATGDTNSGNSEMSGSDQEIYDMAKKLLMANGLSLEDIANGKNYDKGSSYTEPRQAWDMNRITKLLKDKKIKLEGDTVQDKASKNSLSNASQQNQNVRSVGQAKTK